MNRNRQIRVIKRDQRASAAGPATKPAGETRGEPSERELRTVVSGWVSEHRERTEEFRRAVAGMLRQTGLRLSRA